MGLLECNIDAINSDLNTSSCFSTYFKLISDEYTDKISNWEVITRPRFAMSVEL